MFCAFLSFSQEKPATDQVLKQEMQNKKIQAESLMRKRQENNFICSDFSFFSDTHC